MLWPSLRRRVQRPGWVPTVPEWKCQPWLSTSYLSESSRRYVEREFLFTSALFSRRILHQPGLQGWDRVQVCPQGPDLCCSGYRGIELELRSWSSEGRSWSLWWDHSRMADQGNIYARGNFPLELFCNSKFQENSLFKLMFPTEIPLRLPCYTNISLFALAIFTGTASIKREVCLYSTFCIFVHYKSTKLPNPLILPSRPSWRGAHNWLRGHICLVVIRAFVGSQANHAFLGVKSSNSPYESF